MTAINWDVAFDNLGHVKDSAKLPDFWASRAAQYRGDAVKANRLIDIDIPYGDHPREVFDLVWPDSAPKGLVVFVHGGYWVRLDKSYWTDLAEGARANGWVVCLPSYTLAPEACIGDITQQIRCAIGRASELVSGPIRLCGHSAGGHLVTRMLCNHHSLPEEVLNEEVLNRVVHTVPISGIHDLRPLLRTAMNQSLNLDESQAVAESSALHRPVRTPSITAWVGSSERPEFIRQSKLLAMIWHGLDARVKCHIDEGHDHFSILEGLKLPDSAITMELINAVN